LVAVSFATLFLPAHADVVQRFAIIPELGELWMMAWFLIKGVKAPQRASVRHGNAGLVKLGLLTIRPDSEKATQIWRKGRPPAQTASRKQREQRSRGLRNWCCRAS
jgi:hypothetical protein